MYLAVKEGHKLEVLENKVQRKIAGPGRDEVSGERKMSYNETALCHAAHPESCGREVK
jgi:hypothetical protein